jgi:Tol biopolymer transport system component
MGEVYRARDTRLDRMVAIKVLPAHLSASAQARERFEREAKAISSLSHPHICPLYDVGHQDGTDFLVMEYLEGETLADRLKKGRLPLEQVLQYAIQIADALDAAHSHSVIHRDLKPGNIMLTKSGAKLLDFGLAKAHAAEAAAGMTSGTTKTTPLTGEGTILGTLQYMAPEQLEGGEVDARTDLFALGAVIYEMATGKKAFEGKSQASLIAAILDRDPPPVSTVQSVCPPALDHVVQTCLTKAPESRWQTARDISIELKWITQSGSAPTVSSGPAPRMRVMAWLAGAVLLAALGLSAGAVLWSRFGNRAANADPPLRKFAITPAAFVPVQSFCCSGASAISPNGRYIAYLTQRKPDDPKSVSLYDLETGETRPLTGTEGAELPFWPPASDFVGFTTSASVKKVPTNGGPVVTIASGTYYGGSWSPDGQEIVLTDSTSPALWTVPSVGGRAKTLWQSPKDIPINARFVRTVSGNRAVVFLLGEAVQDLMILDTANQVRTLLSGDTNSVFAHLWPVWSPTGHLIFQRQFTDRLSGLWAVRYSLNTLSVLGEPFPIAENAVFPSVSNDGTLTYMSAATSRQSRLVWLDRTGQPAGEIGEPQLDMYVPSVSPDGRYVAVEGIEAATGADIWLHDTVRATKTRLTLDPARDSRPFWSRDGKQVVFWSLRNGGKLRNFIQNVDGSQTAESVAEDVRGFVTDWSPDGKYILLEDPIPSRVWCVKRLASGKWEACSPTDPKLTTPGIGSCARFSPNGRFIAYVNEEPGTDEIYVATFPGLERKWHVSSGGGTQPVWSRNGRELFYVKKDTLFAVPVSTNPEFSFSSPVRLFSDPAFEWQYSNPTYDVSPDGKRFVVIKPVGPMSQPAIWVVQNWYAEFRDRMSGR